MDRRKLHSDGTPNLSIEQIEEELRDLRFRPTRTELWMGARAKAKMQKLGEQSADLKHAYEAGYREGIEVKMLGAALLFAAMTLLAIFT